MRIQFIYVMRTHKKYSKANLKDQGKCTLFTPANCQDNESKQGARIYVAVRWCSVPFKLVTFQISFLSSVENKSINLGFE